MILCPWRENVSKGSRLLTRNHGRQKEVELQSSNEERKELSRMMRKLRQSQRKEKEENLYLADLL
jgi:hypothetical protein